MSFADLGLCEPIVNAVTAEGYENPTPIQAQAIPHVMQGRDLFGCAQTGTGKTAAFSLPIIHRLMEAGVPSAKARRPIRALILAPTRELAIQIADCILAYSQKTHIRHTLVFGGVSQVPQVRALQRGVDIVIATPGRLCDLMGQGHVDLSHVETFVLDEADRMLDMGFIHDIRHIAERVPKQRQTLFFSATMPREIRELSSSLLRNPVAVEITPVATAAETVEQAIFIVPQSNKPRLLHTLLAESAVTRSLVFTRTKHGADKVLRHLMQAGIRADAIHGGKTQSKRQRALADFKANRLRVLVATDIAARGIDVDGISHVINYDMPVEIESYVHRIGRTGRAGATGIAWTFCDPAERSKLRAIERAIRQPIEIRKLPTLMAPPAPTAVNHEFETREPHRPARPTSGSAAPPRRSQNQSGESIPQTERRAFGQNRPGGSSRRRNYSSR
ncbi:DEAD/DEAH box helicase [Schlesneria paludicola]|uniref:DEAD/DEAH box helicase n=1 Tax=Schlesneria paludicola TaxID=360056 RepID=UPI0002DE5A74|nr:DEAD/DEAH box helicase [Schlesneria paludicola]